MFNNLKQQNDENKIQLKQIKGYENYAVAEDGTVFSLNYRRTGEVKELTPVKTAKGYLHVLLYDKHGEPKWFYIHKLVAEAFCDNKFYLTEVNHKDEDKSNNSADNLEFCTHRYNINYGTAIERRVASRKRNAMRKVAEIEMLVAREQFEIAKEIYEEALNNFEKASA